MAGGLLQRWREVLWRIGKQTRVGFPAESITSPNSEPIYQVYSLRFMKTKGNSAFVSGLAQHLLNYLKQHDTLYIIPPGLTDHLETQQPSQAMILFGNPEDMEMLTFGCKNGSIRVTGVKFE